MKILKNIRLRLHRLLWLVKPYRFVLLFFLFFFAGISQFNKGSYSFSPMQGQAAARAELFTTHYSEEEIEFIDHQITRLLIDNQFNGNVMLVRYGMLIYERSFGFACFRSREPVNAETTFQLASISKTFTATAVLLLQERGLLNIEDAVQQHIPEFPWPGITVRHMLTHTSGLQNYMWMVERYWRGSNRPTNEDVLALFRRHPRPLNFTPGQRFDYSNTGYVFLALLIERLSGQSYAEFIHENIFSPLGMHRSFVHDLQNPIPMENRAFGFRQWRGSQILIPDDHLDGPLGDKGIFSTTGDLYIWDQALYRSRLLPSTQWQQAFDYARLNNDSTINYGYGWRLQKYLDKRIVHHPGRWHGFRTSFKRFVDDHTTLILLSNNNRNIAEIIGGIQDILYYDEKEIWMALHGETEEEQEEEQPQEPGIEPQ